MLPVLRHSQFFLLETLAPVCGIWYTSVSLCFSFYAWLRGEEGYTYNFFFQKQFPAEAEAFRTPQISPPNPTSDRDLEIQDRPHEPKIYPQCDEYTTLSNKFGGRRWQFTKASVASCSFVVPHQTISFKMVPRLQSLRVAQQFLIVQLTDAETVMFPTCNCVYLRMRKQL